MKKYRVYDCYGHNVAVFFEEKDASDYCNHDELWVDIEPEKVSEEDLEMLRTLGFFPFEDGSGFYSFRFGSC